MILTNVIRFPVPNSRGPEQRRATPATVVILPVIHRRPFEIDHPPMSPSKRAIRLMNLRTMERE